MVAKLAGTDTHTKMRVFTLDNMYLLSQIGVVLFGLAVFITGKLVNDRESEKSDRLTKELAEQRQKTEEQRGKTAKLEKEAADARLELAGINPLNRTVSKIEAKVFLLIKSDFNEQHLWTLKANAVINGLVKLQCTSFETTPVISNEPQRIFKMSFDWPSNEWLMGDDNPAKPPIDVTKMSVKAFDEKTTAVTIGLPPTTDNSKRSIELQGSCVVTINGEFRQEFEIPRQPSGWQLGTTAPLFGTSIVFHVKKPTTSNDGKKDDSKTVK